MKLSDAQKKLIRKVGNNIIGANAHDGYWIDSGPNRGFALHRSTVTALRNRRGKVIEWISDDRRGSGVWYYRIADEFLPHGEIRSDGKKVK
jgi:hypothetical protein